MEEMLSREVRLLGKDSVEAIRRSRVLLFGVGGVGGWCAESLVRSGIGHLTIVDCDHVSETNRNRQVVATSRTVGRVKVEAMKERLLELNPDASITALDMAYSEETAQEFYLEEYDYVIDAIDSLKDKLHLILHATGIPTVTFFSSMGAALRTDPFKVRRTEFWKVKDDPLAAALRHRMRHRKMFPARKFMCVYSEELPQPNRGADDVFEEKTEGKAQINGTIAHVVAIFGFSLAGMVIEDIVAKSVSGLPG